MAGTSYVEPDAQVLVDGVVCSTCTMTLGTAAVTGAPLVEIDLEPLTAGMHVVQVLNPDSWASNELPVLVKIPEPEPEPEPEETEDP